MSVEREEADRAAQAMRDDVGRVAKGRVCHWVAVHEIAQRLGLTDDVADAAVKRAIEQGWFVADAEPPYSVRLGALFAQID